MSARLELSPVSVVSQTDVRDLNTVHDLGIDYSQVQWDEFDLNTLNKGGGKLCVYIGEIPHMLDVNGREVVQNLEGELDGMVWYVNGNPEFGVQNPEGWQTNESIVKGWKDPELYKHGCIAENEVFMLDLQDSKIVEFNVHNNTSETVALPEAAG